MQKSFVGAMKEFFGLLPGKTIVDFGKELKGLDYDGTSSNWGKKQFAEGLRLNGIDCKDPDNPANPVVAK